MYICNYVYVNIDINMNEYVGVKKQVCFLSLISSPFLSFFWGCKTGLSAHSPLLFE